MLTEVENAISAVLKGKSYTVDGVTVTRENLKELREWRAELKCEIDRENNGSIRLARMARVRR